MQQRIRVVEIIYGFGVEGAGGGAGRFAIELSQRLDPEWFQSAVYSLWDLGTHFEKERIQQLQARKIDTFAAAPWDETGPYRSFWQAIKNLQEVLRRRPADILHSHSEFGDMAALFLKSPFRPPAILRTVHNGHPVEWRKRPLRRLLLTHLLYPLRFSKEVGVSRNIVQTLDRRPAAKWLGRQALYIPNAIDLDRFKNITVDIPQKKVSLCIPANARVVGTIGRLSAGKGHDILLQAAKNVLNHLPQVTFLVVGGGELEPALKELAGELGIGSQVIFTGPRSDVPELLACMDLFVSPSLWEGLSTVILESMASRVPVLAADIPGNREIIQDPTHGRLVPPQEPAALAGAIVQILNDAPGRYELARRALQQVQRFSIETVVAQHETLYGEISDPQRTKV